uniref:Uncharacterized protein n=1 Tax=Anguilla anguilla TaxID=7936 RepID=A0A0E9UZR4_ANGAN
MQPLWLKGASSEQGKCSLRTTCPQHEILPLVSLSGSSITTRRCYSNVESTATSPAKQLA